MTSERFEKLKNVLDNRQENLVIVLENVFDPHNISAVMRSCDAVGVQDIYVLNTSIPKHKKYGVSSSASAKKWVTVHDFNDVDTCVEHLKTNGYKILTSHMNTASMDMYSLDFTERIALVFGNESVGVSDELLAKSDGNFLIPQMGMVQSLNISVACAVTLFEAMRQKMANGDYAQSQMPKDKYDALWKLWEENDR